jgi:hypothetical protein
MVPAPQARRGLAVVRRRRLLVEGGTLVLVHESGQREVLARPGEVVAAWWTPVEAAVGRTPPSLQAHPTVTDLLILERRGAPALVLRLSEWLPTSARTPFDVTTGTDVAGWPGPPEEPSLSAAVRLTAADAVVASLGCEIQPAAREQRLEALRAVLARGSRLISGMVEVPVWLRVPAISATALSVLLLALVILRVADRETSYLLAQAAGVLTSAVVFARVALLAAAERQRDHVELPATPWRPEPTVPTSSRFVERARVSAAPDWLVVRDQHDREGWTPGPVLGGATTVRMAWPWLAFHDPADAPLWTLKLDEWMSQDELPGRLDQLRQAGYDVTGDARPGPTERAWFGIPVVWSRGSEPLGVLSDWADRVYVLVLLSLLMQVGFAVEQERLPLLAVLPVLALVLGVAEAVLARRGRRGILKERTPARRPHLGQDAGRSTRG